MSTRERFTKKTTEFPICEKKRQNWTDNDKEKLLSALQKYGYKDIDKISAELPNKTKGAIRALINRLNKEARESVSSRDSHIDHWLNSGLFQGPDTLISQALKFISMFEEHPTPEESAGCDFRALYDVLSKVTLGYPPGNITRMTHETISHIMAQTTNEVWPYYQDEITEYVQNLEQEKTRKTYPGASTRIVIPKQERDSN